METEDSVNTGTNLTVGASTKSTQTGKISGATGIAVCCMSSNRWPPQLLVDMFEPSLFLWQWPSTKDRLQVDPALLDQVEVHEELIQSSSSVSYPSHKLDMVRKGSKVGESLRDCRRQQVSPTCMEHHANKGR